jgi:hypothetical protein
MPRHIDTILFQCGWDYCRGWMVHFDAKRLECWGNWEGSGRTNNEEAIDMGSRRGRARDLTKRRRSLAMVRYLPEQVVCAIDHVQYSEVAWLYLVQCCRAGPL